MPGFFPFPEQISFSFTILLQYQTYIQTRTHTHKHTYRHPPTFIRTDWSFFINKTNPPSYDDDSCSCFPSGSAFDSRSLVVSLSATKFWPREGQYNSLFSPMRWEQESRGKCLHSCLFGVFLICIRCSIGWRWLLFHCTCSIGRNAPPHNTIEQNRTERNGTELNTTYPFATSSATVAYVVECTCLCRCECVIHE